MRVLVTGSAGVVGSTTADLLETRYAPAVDVVRTARRACAPGVVAWNMGHEPAPPCLRTHWDAIIHTAASTRWTMTTAEAAVANVEPVEALRSITGPGTHVVHVSTAYLVRQDTAGPRPQDEHDEHDGYRNAYEWSKARCEARLRDWHDVPLTIVRPPLVLGRSDTGAISRFSGPYTLLQAMISGLAAAVVGDPDGYVEIAPVDQVAAVLAAAALGPAPAPRATWTIAAGAGSMRLRTLLDVSCSAINQFRRANDVAPITAPPFISATRWHRFFLPFARQHLSPVQNEAVTLLGMFESYTSMPAPFTPTHVVQNPEDVLVRSIEWWANEKPRQVLRDPVPWGLVGTHS